MTARIGIRLLVALAAASAALYVWDRAGEDDVPARPADHRGPWIEWEEDLHDFGVLFTGEVNSHEFTFRNRGTEPLRVLDTKKECGCTKPTFDRKVIEPGGSGIMTVAFSPPIAGQAEKRIWIYTNDEFARETIVRLRGSGRGTADLVPPILDLDGETIGSAGLRRELRLAVAPSKRILDVTFNCENPWMRMERTGGLGTRETTLAITIDRPPHPTQLREQIPIFITAEGPDGKRTTFGLVPTPFQVVGTVTPEEFAEPSVVHFGVVAAGAERTRELRLHGPDGDPAFEVEGAEGVEIERTASAAYALKVRGSGAARRVAGRAVFRWPDGRTVAVPFHAWSGS